MNKKGGVVCGPGYGDGGTKTGVCVRKGEDVAVGCTITVDAAQGARHDAWRTRANWVEQALTEAGYRWERKEQPDPLRSESMTVVFSDVRLMVRPATGKVVANGYRTRKQPVHAKATGSVATVDGVDCLEGTTEDGRRVYLEIYRGKYQSEGDALRELARRLLEVAAKRDQYPRAA
jgi:hypothetical protein